MMKIVRNTLYLLCLSALLFWNCAQKETKPEGLSIEFMDLSVSPAEDFFRYVNGKWLDSTAIPADQGRWGSFDELRKANNKVVLTVLEKAIASGKYSAESDQQKVADFYAVGMDSLRIEEMGVKPLEPWFEKIDAVKSIEDLQSVLAEMHIIGFTGFIGGAVFADLKDSETNALYLDVNGLGLPNCEYYTKMDDKSIEIREKYVKHIERMLGLACSEGADFAKHAQTVFAIENQLALVSMTPPERRNYPLIYNKMDIKGLSKITPSLNWEKYFSDMRIESIDSFIVTEPKYMTEFEKIITKRPIDDIKWYLKWHVVDFAASYLSYDLVAANFDFYGRELDGTEAMRPRWERVLGITSDALGEALGKLYVDEVFPPQAKASAKEMVDYILKAFEGRIKNLEWMSDTTKEKALTKLSTFTVKIGYPDEWKNYSKLAVDKSSENHSYFNNVLNAMNWSHNEAVAKVGKPVDKKEWGMNPQEVNAYYDPTQNEIVFPAAILQPPFYNYKADAAVNFGGIGAVIAHEVSHGFDDKGSMFDSEGNMEDWWTAGDKKQFEERTDVLVAQFNEYEPLPGVFVQGDFTLGENIGDLGGVNIAYDGLQLYYKDHQQPGLIDNFTQNQRLFISWATIWRIKYRDEYVRNQVITDPHSPGNYRAFGPLVNMETFYAAFDVNEGNAMWRPDSLRAQIW